MGGDDSGIAAGACAMSKNSADSLLRYLGQLRLSNWRIREETVENSRRWMKIDRNSLGEESFHRWDAIENKYDISSPMMLHPIRTPNGELRRSLQLSSGIIRGKKVDQLTVCPLLVIVGERFHLAQALHLSIASPWSNQIQCRGVKLPEDTVSGFGSEEKRPRSFHSLQDLLCFVGHSLIVCSVLRPLRGFHPISGSPS